VRDEIKYNMISYIPQIKANFKASTTLRRGYGFCVSKAILLSSFARALGIPARIHLVDIINHKISEKVVEFMGTNIMYYHGYSELWINNRWKKLTPSLDKATCIKAGFLPLVSYEKGVFPIKDENGGLFVEYLKDRETHADLPLEEIEKVFENKYGKIFSGGMDIKPIKDKRITYKDQN
jgi:hypothetical protein